MNAYAENRSPFVRASSLESEPSDEKDVDKLFAVNYPLRILIADDNAINRRVLSLTLKRFGYQVDQVENGLDCLSTVVMGSYDLVLMDVQMPFMDGIECTRAIRKAGLELSIVAVTAMSPQEARVECLAAGMNGYLEKPVHCGELKHALRVAFLKHMFSLA